MAYVNKQNLSDFWSNAKRYIAARDADQCDWTSIPVNAPVYRFEAEPRTPVNPVVEFGFTETPPASGDKSPSNPSTITGVESVTVTRTGKNVLPLTFVQAASTTNLTATTNSDGSVSISGSPSNNVYVYFFNYSLNVNNFPDFLKKNVLYTMSFLSSSDSIYAHAYKSTNAEAWGNNFTANIFNGQSDTFTIPSDTTGFLIRVTVRPGTYSNATIKLQIEKGSTATSFEPYSGVTATVNLGETRYGGTLDVATGKMTVTHVVHIFDGVTKRATDHPGTVGTDYRHGITLSTQNIPKAIGTPSINNQTSTHFNYLNGTVGAFGTAVVTGNYFIIHDKNGLYPDTNSFNGWLAEQYNAGTPVTFVYAVETPFTIDLSPQQLFSALSNSKVNTVFTDTGTITQLTYAKPAPTQEDVFRYANWHRTETAGAVTCCPVPESELHPVVNFSFTETPPEEGEKGPDNPSTITGVSGIEVTFTGKNLVSLPYHGGSNTYNGITWTVNSDNSVTANGTASADVNFYFTGRDTTKLRLNENNTYFLSGCPTGGSTSTYCLTAVSGSYNTYVRCYDIGNGVTYIPQSSDVCVVHALIKQGVTVSGITFRPQLESGNSKTNYEIVSRKRDAIQLNGTYYGGSIDLSTGLMTVTHEAETITHDNANTSVEVLTNTIKMTCNITNKHLGGSGDVYWACEKLLCDSTNNDIEHIRPSGNTILGAFSVLIFINKSRLDVSGAANPSSPTDAEWKAAGNAWLASNPVTLVYKLFTPFTVQLTPQQIKALPALDRHEPRINTLYTDADSIQVSYQKSPIQTELELTDAILALGGGE